MSNPATTNFIDTTRSEAKRVANSLYEYSTPTIYSTKTSSDYNTGYLMDLVTGIDDAVDELQGHITNAYEQKEVSEEELKLLEAKFKWTPLCALSTLEPSVVAELMESSSDAPGQSNDATPRPQEEEEPEPEPPMVEEEPEEDPPVPPTALDLAAYKRDLLQIYLILCEHRPKRRTVSEAFQLLFPVQAAANLIVVPKHAQLQDLIARLVFGLQIKVSRAGRKGGPGANRPSFVKLHDALHHAGWTRIEDDECFYYSK